MVWEWLKRVELVGAVMVAGGGRVGREEDIGSGVMGTVEMG